MGKCTSVVKDYSGGMGAQYSIWAAPFKRTVKNGTELPDSSANGIALNNRVKTFGYKLMNKMGLLLKSLFFYNVKESDELISRLLMSVRMSAFLVVDLSTE